MVKNDKPTDMLSHDLNERPVETSAFPAVPVSERPLVELVRWQVMQLANGSRHFVGWNENLQAGRATASIVKFDAETRRGVTVPARAHILRGPHGEEVHGANAWRRWMRLAGKRKATDVSADVWAFTDAARSQRDETGGASD